MKYFYCKGSYIFAAAGTGGMVTACRMPAASSRKLNRGCAAKAAGGEEDRRRASASTGGAMDARHAAADKSGTVDTRRVSTGSFSRRTACSRAGCRPRSAARRRCSLRSRVEAIRAAVRLAACARRRRRRSRRASRRYWSGTRRPPAKATRRAG